MAISISEICDIYIHRSPMIARSGGETAHNRRAPVQEEARSAAPKGSQGTGLGAVRHGICILKLPETPPAALAQVLSCRGALLTLSRTGR